MALSRWQIKINYQPRDFLFDLRMLQYSHHFFDKINIIFISRISYHALIYFNFFKHFTGVLLKNIVSFPFHLAFEI